MHTLLFIVIVTILTATQAFAKVASIEFTNLVADSELIVIAKVESVSSPLIGKKYAKARVLEVWKGTNSVTVEFLASPTWTCDISQAKAGDTVLLFLTKSDESRSYAIAHSGRGRFPLRVVDGKNYVTFWPDVLLPKEMLAIDDPEPKENFSRTVEVTRLRDTVKKPRQQ
jgi:hypothetical protein